MQCAVRTSETHSLGSQFVQAMSDEAIETDKLLSCDCLMDSIWTMNLRVISPFNCNVVTLCLWESSPIRTVPPCEGCTDVVKAGLVYPSPRSLVLVSSYLFCVVCCDDATEED